MAEVETRVTDVKSEQNKLKLIVGLFLIGVGILLPFLDIKKILRIIGAVSFGIIGSYMLATWTRQKKSIAIKLMKPLKIKSGIKPVKIKENKKAKN